MKALKVFASIILAFFMLLSLIVFSGVLLFRVFLSGPSLGNIAKSMVEQNNTFEMDSLFDGMKFDNDEINKIMDDMDEYVSKEEMYDEIGDLASQMIRYAAGNINHIDGTRLKETLKEAAKKYEKKTGEDVDLQELDDSIDEAIEELEKEARESETPPEVTSIFNTAYSNGPLIGSAAVFVVCGLLIVVMFKSIKPLLIHLSILGFLHGITNGILSLAVGAIPIDDDSMKFVIDPVKGLFMKTSLICIAIAVISIILIIVLSVIKKNKQVAPVNEVQYQPQGDVIDQIRATSMMPNQPNNTFNNNPNDPNNNNFNQ